MHKQTIVLQFIEELHTFSSFLCRGFWGLIILLLLLFSRVQEAIAGEGTRILSALSLDASIRLSLSRSFYCENERMEVPKTRRDRCLQSSKCYCLQETRCFLSFFFRVLSGIRVSPSILLLLLLLPSFVTGDDDDDLLLCEL